MIYEVSRTVSVFLRQLHSGVAMAFSTHNISL